MMRSWVSSLVVAVSLLHTAHFSSAQATAASDLGTLDSPTYQKWLPSSNNIAVNNTVLNSSVALANSPPWGLATTSNTSPYTGAPNTGVTRYYEWTVARGTANPGGKERPVILVNNQFPGPLIEANWGDMIQVVVHNNISDEGTSLHWHGLLQNKTQSMDGVPGIDQCPIAPGKSRTYNFRADLYGSSWWHSHYSAQYAAGLFGPMIIHGPWQDGCDWDVDLGPVILSDWSFSPYEDLVEQSVGKGLTGRVFSNISLINGKTDSVFRFQEGNTYRLRLINTAAEASYVFSIDDHEFTVIAHDFVPIEPYTTNNVTLAVAQRADIIVKATGNSTSSFWMRSTAQDCALVNNHTAKARVYYQDADTSKPPRSEQGSFTTVCVSPDPSIGIPAWPSTPPTTPEKTVTLEITAHSNGTLEDPGSPLWWINNSSFRVNYDEPVLLHVAQGNFTFESDWNVYNHGDASSVRIVLYNTVPAQHPMHLHGHNFWVVAQGSGIWNGTRNVPNLNNPVRRDTYIIDAASGKTPAYLVIEYMLDNPGVWPFHCHIAWHVSGGLYTSQVEKGDQIKNIPQDAYNTCKEWKAWQSVPNIVNQIDSGER